MFSLLPVTLFPLRLPRPLRSLDSFRQELAGVGAERCRVSMLASDFPWLWGGLAGVSAPGI